MQTTHTIAALILAITPGFLLAQDQHTSRSTIVDLTNQTQHLTQLAKELHSGPIEDIREAFGTKLQVAIQLREQMASQSHAGDSQDKLTAARFEASLADVLATVDSALGKLLDGESRVMAAIDENLAISMQNRGQIAATLQSIEDQLTRVGPQRALRQAKLQELNETYGGLSNMPASQMATVEKLTSDIHVCDQVQSLLVATRNEHQQRLNSLSEFEQAMQSKKRAIDVTYHIATGHRNIIAHLVEYREARAKRGYTENEIERFDEQLKTLVGKIGTGDLEELMDTSVEIPSFPVTKTQVAR